MEHSGIRIPDIIAVVLTVIAAIAVMWSPYHLWFPVVLAGMPALWLLYRYLSLRHELKTGNPGIAKVVGTEHQTRTTQLRNRPDITLHLYAPVVEYETPNQKMHITYPVFSANKWFEEGRSYPIHYSVRHPWQFWFLDRKKERLLRLETMLVIVGPAAAFYAACLGIAYLLV